MNQCGDSKYTVWMNGEYKATASSSLLSNFIQMWYMNVCIQISNDRIRPRSLPQPFTHTVSVMVGI